LGQVPQIPEVSQDRPFSYTQQQLASMLPRKLVLPAAMGPFLFGSSAYSSPLELITILPASQTMPQKFLCPYPHYPFPHPLIFLSPCIHDPHPQCCDLSSSKKQISNISIQNTKTYIPLKSKIP
jgi:hypothetical protein